MSARSDPLSHRTNREVKDTNTKLRMTNEGNMMVNDELEIHGRRLNELGTTDDQGQNERRRLLLQATADHNQGKSRKQTRRARSSNIGNKNDSSSTCYLAGKTNDANYQGTIKSFKGGAERLFFEIDRRVVQEKFGGISVDGKKIFERMSVGVADRLFRVYTPMGGNANDIIAAATEIANEMKTTNPRQFADTMEFVNCKRTVKMINVWHAFSQQSVLCRISIRKRIETIFCER